MKKFLPFTILFFSITILIIFYFSLGNDRVYETRDVIGKNIGKIDLELFNTQESFNTEELTKNEFTIINFWASWCGPCRREHKYLVDLSKNNKLKILGVNFKDNKKEANKFLNELGNPYFLLVSDPKGKKSISFGVYGIPETILVNSKLIILKKYIGPLNHKDVNEIKRLVNK